MGLGLQPELRIQAECCRLWICCQLETEPRPEPPNPDREERSLLREKSEDTRRTREGHEKDTTRTPQGHHKDTTRTPQGHHKDTST
ncbi:hypothetical protein EYF80_040554 [Liparis tanakae]|uniref:Uncharacterized protein n=1 Tax=Liparis tanakae TaxID=230148 RepID=A0A4Z2G6S0_9TELE|nr:hypothetical protein EYF80_040554 [Liparis tanakae]